MKIQEYIKKTPNKQEWCVYSEGGKNMGCYPSKGEAEKRLQQIEYFKHKESDMKDKINEVVGKGQGVGGPKQGDGGVETCICPSCGTEAKHDRGTPCTEAKCPNCGASMVGKPKEATKESFYKYVLESFNIHVSEQVDTEGGIEKVLRAVLVDQYGMSKSDASELVKAGFNMEKVTEIMERIELADKLKAEYLKLLNVWKSDVDMQAYNDLEFLMKESKLDFELMEAQNKEGTVWKVAVIEQGKSYNKTVYSEQALDDIVDIINNKDKEGAPVQCNAFKFEDTLNHLPETARKFVKGFTENIIGWFKKAKKVGKQVIAELHLDEGAEKIKSLLMTAYKKGIKKPFGLSIDGDGKVEEGFDGAEPVLNVMGVMSLNSIDCVTYPSAGGKFLSLIESVFKEETMFKLLLEMIGKIYPELIKDMNLDEADIKTAKKVLEEAEKKDERFKFELTEENVADAIKQVTDVELKLTEEKVKAEVKESEEGEGTESEGEDEGGEEKKDEENSEGSENESETDNKGDDEMKGLTEAQKAHDELKKLREEYSLETCKMLLNRVLGESGLPEVFKDQIRDEFKDRIFEEKDLREKVEKTEKVVSAFEEEKTGGSKVNVETTEREKQVNGLQASMDILCGVTDENGKLVEGVDRWKGSIRRAYIDITGDEEVSGEVAPWERRSRLHESITTGDFPYILKNSQTKRLVREYNIGEAMYRKVAKVVPIDNFKTQDRPSMGEFANLATVAEDDAYTEFTDPSEETATYVAITKGNIIGISRRAILNDDLGKFNKLVTMLGRSALKTVNQFTFDMLLNYVSAINDGTIYDTKALYHVDHDNIATTALSFSNIDTALTAMYVHKDMDDTLQMGIEGKTLWVPRELKSTAIQIIKSVQLPGGEYNDPNPVYDALEVEVSPYLRGDTNNWYIQADPNVWDGIELGFVLGKETPTIISASAETVQTMFTNDRLQYKIRHEYGAVTVDYRPFYAGIVA